MPEMTSSHSFWYNGISYDRWVTNQLFYFFHSCSYISTAKLSEVRIHILALLNRHSMVFGNYRWTEFDEDFLQKHVESVAIVDLEELVTQVCYFGLL